MDNNFLVRSEKLSALPGVRCAVSTRRGGVSPEPFGMNTSFRVGDDPAAVRMNRKLLFERVGGAEERTVFARQQHSTEIRIVSSPGEYDACDGFLTQTQDLWLAVSIADCAPVFVADQKRRVVGAFHAGWRGTAGRIVERGVALMTEAFGTKGEDVVAFVGPSAGGCCYEVGSEVANLFSEQAVRHVNGSLHLDLKAELARQLRTVGVLHENIELSKHCTICQAETFHSFRRDNDRSGRMLGIIGLKG
jgi:YfiH family protein